MILPTRGKYLCEVISRIKQTESGLWLADKLKDDAKDNVARCIGVGSPTIKTCTYCHYKKQCKTKCKEKGKLIPIVAKRTDYIHYKAVYAKKIKYNGKLLVFLTHEDIIAIETESGDIKAPGSNIIIKISFAEKSHGIIIPDIAKRDSGEYWGEVVAVGNQYPDKSLKIGDKLLYLRNEGYKFKTYKNNIELYSVREKWCDGKRGDK